MMCENYLIGIITYKRVDFFSQCLDSVLKTTQKDNIFVVNDGTPYDVSTYKGVRVIQHEKNKGVTAAKNTAFDHFLQNKQYKYLFLLEDDIIIKQNDTFKKYIQTSQETGIEHFNYGPGSPFNRKQDASIPIDLHTRHLLEQNSEPNPRLIVEYKNNIKVALYQHTVAMFSFFTRSCLEKIGKLDERFAPFQSWEHVDHTYRIYKHGLTTPFWWFADIYNSHEYLSEAPGAIDKSSIAEKRDEWMQKVTKGRELYKDIHGWYPNHTPDKTEAEVLTCLKKIKEKNAK